MSLYLLDTNVLSRFARGLDPSIADQIDLHLEDCVLSSIAWYELQYGAKRSPTPVRAAERIARLRSFFPFIRAFGEEEAAASSHARFCLETLKPNAQPIGPNDVLLAGHALALGAVFVTHNVREFSRVPGLVIEDWQGG